MPNKHFYVAMGVANAALLVLAVRLARRRLYHRYPWFRRLYAWDRDWFLYFPLAFVPFALWALVPDILHGTALVAKETTRGPAFNVFYLHSWFEMLEDANPRLDWALNTLGSATLLAVGLATFVFYVREYHRAAATPAHASAE